MNYFPAAGRKYFSVVLAGFASLAIAWLNPILSTAQADEDPHAQHRQIIENNKSGDKSGNGNSADIILPDAELVTQDGLSVRLRSDVVADKIVVIDFVYTTCTTVCPILSAILGQVQTLLDDRLGSEVMLVSISVDPNRDTPARLKAYSARYRAKDGWVWLTGRKQTVDAVLEKLGAYAPNFEEHPSMVLVGDGRSGDWTRFLGFPGADEIMAKVDELTAERPARMSQAAEKENQ